jgi:hypothetical protein
MNADGEDVAERREHINTRRERETRGDDRGWLGGLLFGTDN